MLNGGADNDRPLKNSMGKEFPTDPPSQAIRKFEKDDTRSISELVVEAVAEVAEVDPLELPPLHSSLDPDALDRLFGRKLNGQPRDTDFTITFRMSDRTVTVVRDGAIHVTTTEMVPE